MFLLRRVEGVPIRNLRPVPRADQEATAPSHPPKKARGKVFAVEPSPLVAGKDDVGRECEEKEHGEARRDDDLSES